jgi:ABC-2 type transport system ATP-binding protein
VRLSFEGVECRYPQGAPVLREITFAIGRGLWLVVGPNGSGKSTLLRCAAGLLPPAAGAVRWGQEDAYRLGPRYRWVLGYAPQEVGGYPALTLRSYMHYLGELKGILPGRLAGRVADVLALAGLTDWTQHRVEELSGGLKARLGMAQALLNDPNLLLLDEPTAGLDPQERVRFRQLALDCARDRIVIVATNIPEDTEGVADGVIHLRDGRCVAIDV